MRIGDFLVGITGAKDLSALHTFEYSLDKRSLGQKLVARAMGGMIQVASFTSGEHKLYIEATAPNGKRTLLVEYPFSVK